MIPKHLSHRPIIAVDNYNLFDGAYAPNTDAEALSLGFATHDHSQISLKVFRRVKGRWSRQSEEMPIHRTIDLNILFAKSLMLSKGLKHVSSTLQEDIV